MWSENCYNLFNSIEKRDNIEARILIMRLKDFYLRYVKPALRTITLIGSICLLGLTIIFFASYFYDRLLASDFTDNWPKVYRTTYSTSMERLDSADIIAKLDNLHYNLNDAKPVSPKMMLEQIQNKQSNLSEKDAARLTDAQKNVMSSIFDEMIQEERYGILKSKFKRTYIIVSAWLVTACVFCTMVFAMMQSTNLYELIKNTLKSLMVSLVLIIGAYFFGVSQINYQQAFDNFSLKMFCCQISITLTASCIYYLKDLLDFVGQVKTNKE